MKFLPLDNLSIRTATPPERVASEIARNVAPVPLFRFLPPLSPHPPFEGAVWAQGFRIARISWLRHPFKPVLNGRIEPDGTGTLITVRLYPHPVVLAFAAWWFGMVVMFALCGVLALFGSRDPTLLLACVAMGLFACILFMGDFWLETPRAKRLFETMIASTSFMERT